MRSIAGVLLFLVPFVFLMGQDVAAESCIGCHKEIKKTNKALEASKMALGEQLAATGPTGCNECHPKE